MQSGLAGMDVGKPVENRLGDLQMAPLSQKNPREHQLGGDARGWFDLKSAPSPRVRSMSTCKVMQLHCLEVLKVGLDGSLSKLI